MPAVVAVPQLGKDMAGGVVAEWYRPDGSKVDVGELVCRLECDFVAVEIEAEAPGVLRHRKPAGSIERPGTVLAVLLAPGEAVPADDSPALDRAESDEPEPLKEAPVQADDAAPAPQFADDPPPMAPGEPVVLPFRRRSTDRPEHVGEWEEVAGDVAAFASGLAEGSETAEPLAEPGAGIPGLPLWDDEQRPRRGSFAEADAEFEARYGADEVHEPLAESSERFARIAAEAATAAQVLSVQVTASAGQLLRVREVFAREWRGFGSAPIVEDFVLIAAARALDERQMDSSPAGLVVGQPESELSIAIAEPLRRDIRELVAARDSGGDETFERAAWVLVSLAPLGIDAVQPGLPAGVPLAFGMGAAVAGRITLTMSFDSSVLAETDAGRILARIRSLVEEPYGLFA